MERGVDSRSSVAMLVKNVSPISRKTSRKRLRRSRCTWKDANLLQTRLQEAVRCEDYALASQIRCEIDQVMSQRGCDLNKKSWESLGVPHWLSDRLERLGFLLPTPVQQFVLSLALLKEKDVIVRSQTGSGKTLAFLVPVLSRLDYSQQDNPKVAIVVPTFELGVQVILQAWKLLGNNISQRKPGDQANMFTYFGPRGVRLKGVFEKTDAVNATLGVFQGVTLIVGTPDWIYECWQSQMEGGTPALDWDSIEYLVVDEMDACLELFPDATVRLLERPPRRVQTILCGATISDDLMAMSLSNGWVSESAHMIDLGLGGCVSDTSHCFAKVGSGRKLACLIRFLRQDIKDWDKAGKEDKVNREMPRVIVYTPSERIAKDFSRAARKLLWGKHRVAVLLPGGTEPIRMLETFRDNDATLLICTPAAERGLDLPHVSHVYNLDVPASQEAYLHRAGRLGRIGAQGKGTVTTIVTEEETPAFMELARKVGIELQETREPVVDTEDTEEVLMAMEDIYNLF